MLGVGKHRVKVKGAAVVPSIRNTLQAKIEFANEIGTISWFCTLSDKGKDYLAKQLITLGFQGNDFEDLNKPNMFRDKEVEIVIGQEEYKGKIYTKVKYINEIGGKKFEAIKPEVVKSLGSLKGALDNARKEKGELAGLPNLAPQSAIPKDEEIPW